MKIDPDRELLTWLRELQQKQILALHLYSNLSWYEMVEYGIVTPNLTPICEITISPYNVVIDSTNKIFNLTNSTESPDVPLNIYFELSNDKFIIDAVYVENWFDSEKIEIIIKAIANFLIKINPHAMIKNLF